MENIQTKLDKVIQYPNGKEVATKLIQLMDFRLDSRYESTWLMLDHAMRTIAKRSEQELLGRDELEIAQQGKIVAPLVQAMLDSSDEEWESFRISANVEVLNELSESEKSKLFAFDSGLITGEEFREWVGVEPPPSENREFQLR